MALRYIDPDTTSTAEVNGVAFTIGFWPPREAERITAGIAAVRANGDPESEEARAKALDVHRRMVEYGVRGWDGWEGAPKSAEVMLLEEIHGRKHSRVPGTILHSLYLNNAIWALGLACLEWNNLSVVEKKTSD